MEIKTVWESEKRNGAGVPFMKIVQNGVYYYAERAGTDSVAFILYDKRLQEFAVINERKPPLDSRFGKQVFLKTAFGGSIDKEHSTEQIVIEECKEEAGYTVHTDKVHALGRVLVSTQMNQFCELFLVEVEKYDVGETEPENETEALATIEWMEMSDIFDLEDWKSITIVTKAGRKGLL